MSQVSKVVNLFSDPTYASGFLRQIVSFDDKLHQQDPLNATIQIANSMSIQADRDILDRKDPESRLPTIRDIPWVELDEKLKDSLKEELYLWGEDTRIAERFWHYEGEDIAPVVMRTEQGKEIAYQSSGRDSQKEAELLRNALEEPENSQASS